MGFSHTEAFARSHLFLLNFSTTLDAPSPKAPTISRVMLVHMMLAVLLSLCEVQS